jgi:hypothetical protein
MEVLDRMSSSESEEAITICFTRVGSASTEGPSSKSYRQERRVVKISPSATVKELAERCREVFGFGEGCGGGQCQLHHGFPPRPLDLTVLDRCTLQQAGIRNQDRIDVMLVLPENNAVDIKSAKSTAEMRKKKKLSVVSESAGPELTATKGSESGSASTAVNATTGRNKRAAASAAEASFADTIHRQEQWMREEAKKTSSSSPSPTAKNKKQRLSSTSASTSGPPRFRAASTVGRRLQDGAQISPRKRAKRQGPLASRSSLPSSQLAALAGGDDFLESREEDGALALLQAVERGSSRDRMSRLMRSNWRQAVNSAYEQNQAAARLAAIASDQVRIETQSVVSAAATGTAACSDAVRTPATLVVTYPKGVQGRGNYVDRVEFLPRDLLQSVVAAVYSENPETLRSENMALLSPRVLWSLIYHTMAERQSRDNDELSASDSRSKPGVVSTDVALRTMQPDLDWKFLRRRKEQLSEKALENLRQKQEGEQSQMANDWDAAAAAIESVEQAMAGLSTLRRTQRAAQCHKAASRRVAWNVVTPKEVDEDELIECIGNSLPAHMIAPTIKSLLRLGIHNWRELANAESSQLNVPGVQLETLSSWIETAQERTIEELMVEICGGSTSGVESLLEAANCGTPKDLILWKSMVPSLHDAIQGVVEGQTDAKSNAGAASIPSIEELQQWCDRAVRAVEQLPWLLQFYTPLQSISIA